MWIIKHIRPFLLAPVLIWGQYNATGQGIQINEYCASNTTVLADEDGDFPDWIELYNAGAEAVNLKDYGLSDDIANPLLWRLPDYTLDPGAFLVVFASGKGSIEPPGFWNGVIDKGVTGNT